MKLYTVYNNSQVPPLAEAVRADSPRDAVALAWGKGLGGSALTPSPWAPVEYTVDRWNRPLQVHCGEWTVDMVPSIAKARCEADRLHRDYAKECRVNMLAQRRQRRKVRQKYLQRMRTLRAAALDSVFNYNQG